MSEPTTIPTISDDLHSAFNSYMSSTTIELVAKDNVSFFVHKGILGHNSKPFKDATSGPWAESYEHKILLQDWDEATVGRLVQFLYTGDYRYPGASSSPEKPLTDVGETESVPSAPDGLRNSPLTPLAECVDGAGWKHHGLPVTYAAWLENVDTTEFNFEETLLAHATVYTLAHYKSIEALKALAHGRLSHTLLKLHPFRHNLHLAGNIAILASYVYANTDTLTSSQEPMRRIVSQYVALNFEAWQVNPVAEQMMCRGGDFVKDVLQKICRRLGGGVYLWGLASGGTRYITGLRVVIQNVAPQEYVRELDGATGEQSSNPQTIWLIPSYTMDGTKAATYLSFSQSGVSLLDVIGRSCGSACRINSFRTVNAGTAIADLVMVRCPMHYLDLAKFPGFNGVLTHTAHDASHETLHFLWKSMKVPPA